MTLVLNDEWMLMETAYIVVLLVYIFWNFQWKIWETRV